MSKKTEEVRRQMEAAKKEYESHKQKTEQYKREAQNYLALQSQISGVVSTLHQAASLLISANSAIIVNYVSTQKLSVDTGSINSAISELTSMEKAALEMQKKKFDLSIKEDKLKDEAYKRYHQLRMELIEQEYLDTL